MCNVWFLTFWFIFSDLSGIASSTFHLEKAQKSFEDFKELLSTSFLPDSQVAKTSVISSCDDRQSSEINELNEDICLCETKCGSACSVIYSCDNKNDSSHSNDLSGQGMAKIQKHVIHDEGDEVGLHQTPNDNTKACKGKYKNGTNPYGASKVENAEDAVGVPQTQNVDNVCMIGLHCCGPLTPTMIELFLHCDGVKSLVCVSCCYHSMPVNGKSNIHLR